MTKNMGNTDRIIRMAVVLLVAGLYLGNIITGTLAVILGVVAGIFFLTSIVSICPLYSLVGVKTCRT